MEKLFDKYVWHARVLPAFLTLLPLLVAFFAWDAKIEETAKPLAAAAVGAGMVTMLASLARNAGKKAEERIVKKRGGLPATIMLRHSDAILEKGTKRRYHEALAKLMPTTKAPSPKQEATDGANADQTYQTWIRYLLGKTREKKKFDLVFTENMEYGFRRNLFGLRPLGITVALVSAAVCVWKIVLAHHTKAPVTALEIACLLGCVAMIAVWAFAINEYWVWSAGNAYALRLLEAIDQFSKPVKPAE